MPTKWMGKASDALINSLPLRAEMLYGKLMTYGGIGDRRDLEHPSQVKISLQEMKKNGREGAERSHTMPVSKRASYHYQNRQIYLYLLVGSVKMNYRFC